MDGKRAGTFCFGKANLQCPCWTPGNSSHLSNPTFGCIWHTSASHQRGNWIHISLEGTCWAQVPTSNPPSQIHNTTMSPAAVRSFLPGRHPNTRDAGAARNPWFFFQLQICGYTKCLWKDILPRIDWTETEEPLKQSWRVLLMKFLASV